MDFLIFFIGIIALLRGRTHTVITIITILCSRYLQLPIRASFAVNFLFPHNVEDLGFFLYIIWFATFIIKGKIANSHPLIKSVVWFFIFLICSSLYDIRIGTPVGDTIKYIRQWILLTVVFIAPYIKLSTTNKALKQLTVVCVFVCLYLLAVRVTGIDIFDMKSLEDRGIKPPSYAMVCAILTYANPWGLNTFKKYSYLAILLLPVFLSLKVTYAITIVGLLILFIFLKSDVKVSQRYGMLFVAIAGSAILLFSSNKMMERVSEMVINLTTQSVDNLKAEDNFTYRLAHSVERLQYILNRTDRTIRGLGFISEENYKEDAFVIGLWDPNKKCVTQLDTGDIAWSILFLRLGLLGLAFYLIFYAKLTYKLYKSVNISPTYGAYASVMIVFLFFTSLGNTIIATSEFFFIPLLITNFRYIKYANSTCHLVA